MTLEIQDLACDRHKNAHALHMITHCCQKQRVYSHLYTAII